MGEFTYGKHVQDEKYNSQLLLLFFSAEKWQKEKGQRVRE
jgi:hypothetical protein